MRRSISRGRAAVLSALAAGVLVAGACESDRAIITEPLGEASYDATFGVVGTGRPGGSADVAAASGGTLTLTLTNLEPLVTGAYHAWLGAVGTDGSGADTVGQWISLASFSTDTVITATNALTRNVVVVSIESGAATAPSASQVLWRRFSAAGTGSLSFGNFHPDADSQFVWVATGRGTVGFRAQVLEVEDSALARPPRGYYYATWLVDEDTTGGSATDTLSLGAQTAPWPNRSQSLIDADVNTIPGVVLVGPPGIVLAASSRYVGSGTAPFSAYREVWVTLEPKQGDPATPSPTLVLSAGVPEPVQD